MSTCARDQWLERVKEAVEQGVLVKFSLAAPCGADPALHRLRGRLVRLKAGNRLQLVWEKNTQDITKNFEYHDGLTQVAQLLGTVFKTALAVTTTQHLEWTETRGKQPRLQVRSVQTPLPDPGHDRPKEHQVSRTQPWLVALGVTTTEGAVCKGMESKFRQIHRFVELLEPLLQSAQVGTPQLLSSTPLRLWDMGCGKGYLTFAAHEFLRGRFQGSVKSCGVEMRGALMDQANRVAKDCGCEGLEFLTGTIAEMANQPMDILVALHACDTATDDALAVGIQAGARLLIVSPCCHKEIRPQLRPPSAIADALNHGIFRERQAEFVTDALRAALLEASGYEARVFEFISPEHTSKNLMIAGVRRIGEFDRQASLRKVRELACFYGVTRQHLAERLEISFR